MSDTDKRLLQHAVGVPDHVHCLAWMEKSAEESGEKGLFGRTVDKFPSLFRPSDCHVNINKARDWGTKHSALQDTVEDTQRKYASTAPGERYRPGRKGVTVFF